MSYPTYGGQPALTAYRPPQPRPRKAGWLVPLVLLVLLALLILSAAFGTLYFTESADNASTTATLRTRDHELTEARTARRDVQSKLDETTRKLKDAERSRDQAQDEVTTLRQCRDSARAFMEAVAAGRDVKKEASDLVDTCR